MKKWLNIGRLIVSYLPEAISLVERIKGAKGKQKQQAYIDAIKQAFAGIKAETGKDVLNDPRVEKALRKAGDALVAVQNAIAQVAAE